MSENAPPAPTTASRIGLFLGPALAMLLWALPFSGIYLDSDQPQLNAMAGAFVWMAVWWLTEAIPLAVTSLLPLVLFPLLEIQSAKEVALAYGDSNLFLFLGGFLIALAMERTGLHRRIALSIVSLMGDDPARLLLGFMVATGGMSMWISNTATAMLMLPIAISILAVADTNIQDDTAKRNLSLGLMLGIAYAASIGGVGTLVGTPPNIVFSAYYHEMFPEYPQVSFVGWMLVAFPFSVVMLTAAWMVLAYILFPVKVAASLGGRQVIADELAKLGPIRAGEWRIGIIFFATAALWILRQPVEGWGWAMAFTDDSGKALVDDSTTAIAMAILCFLVPMGNGESRTLLSWDAAVKVPWGVLLLFGGGGALAKAVHASHFDLFLGSQMAGLMGGMPEWAMVGFTATAMIWLTEFTSNTASVQTFNPVLGSAAVQLSVHPLLLLIPATIGASCAFMTPVATAPNAIVFGSGRVPIGKMVKAGVVMNFVSMFLVTLAVLLLGQLLM